MSEGPAVDAWVGAHLEAATSEFGDRPRRGFGTRAWIDEPNARARWASVLIAADWARRWWNDPTLPERDSWAGVKLRRQVLQEIADHHLDTALGLTSAIARSRSMRSYAERRARELEDARRPRAGDFPGKAGGWKPGHCWRDGDAA